jgi:hypothetical protein
MIMRSIVLDMTRYSLFILLLFMGTVCFPQHIEREHRIRKSQFPPVNIGLMFDGSMTNKIRYYKEVDSLETTYILKFKMARLNYLLSFDDAGKLKISGFQVNEIDIPEESFQKIKAYLTDSYEKSRIKRIFQQYPATNPENDESALKNTFQNLLLPGNVYKLIVSGKNDKENNEYDLWFSADGNLIRKRQGLPMDHDRILY